MNDPKERAIPGISANYLIQESLSRYIFFKKYIKNGQSVLDVGCGTGYGTNILNKKGIKVYCLDINEEAIKYAMKNYSKNIIYDIGNAEILPYKDKYFDAICSFEIIEHLLHPDKLLNEVNRVLKSNGIFVISTPNKIIHSPEGIDNPYHIREYTPILFERLLKKYFRKVYLYGQFKTKKVEFAYSKYLKSQNARQKLVDLDILSIRKLFPIMLKEKIWVKIGSLFGRSVQNNLDPSDFPIINNNIETGEYLIAVCIK